MESERPDFLGVLDAATVKGVHQETVRRAIRAGRLPARQFGRTYVIHPADLQAWQPHHEKAPRRQAAHGVPVTLETVPPAAQLGHSDSGRLHSRSRVAEFLSYNLPAPPTPLLVRERELQTVYAYLVSGDTRLVTLTGPGGSGKTRLVLEVAPPVGAARLCRAASDCSAGGAAPAAVRLLGPAAGDRPLAPHRPLAPGPQLLLDRRTNGEIAQELRITARTECERPGRQLLSPR